VAFFVLVILVARGSLCHSIVALLSLSPPLYPFLLRGRFEDPWADEETVLGHPEKDVISYLETSASALGLALDREAKTRALRALRSVTVEEGVDAGATAAGETAADRPVSPPATQESQAGTARNGGGMQSDIGSERRSAGRVSSPQEVLNEATAFKSGQGSQVFQGICNRNLDDFNFGIAVFQVWEVDQPCDEEGRFFLEPSRAGVPPPFEAEDGDTREL